jgi:hypothetical protein
MVWTKNDPGYQQCTLTVMDNIADPDIVFDDRGICNYYYEYKEAERTGVFTGEEGKKKLESLAATITAEGKGKPYDCLIGLSGGVDSSYVAWLVKLGIDLFTLVINWQEFKDIQLAYLRASVVDIEVVSDHAIFATMYKLAKEKSIPYIISGTNIVTEHIMPPSWLYQKMDFANLKDIHQQYGKLKLKTYPGFNFRKYVYYSAILKLIPVSILNYVPYNKKEIKAFITRELSWRDYGGKHYESVFTKFYQAYILPEKFHIDKRKAHLSTLICAGQITKAEALAELEQPVYPNGTLEQDKEYVLKKFDLSEKEFSEIMKLPVRPHQDFKTDTHLKKGYMDFLRKTEKFRRAIKPRK